ncbi:uncharacterized protein KRP23_13630 [Phytophthora ramorum]|uniref:uncharacterized protein n=1 Tax=Phytophthora ramorum TaxID=164328 RepID=UPI0030A1AD84|nr:hypothetical protein KRP23_13630 [Phytophthora ramorum]
MSCRAAIFTQWRFIVAKVGTPSHTWLMVGSKYRCGWHGPLISFESGGLPPSSWKAATASTGYANQRSPSDRTQSQAGREARCQCAGPFGSRLLGLSRDHIVDLGHTVVAKDEILKPGVARMSFPYFADEEEVAYILEAVNFVLQDELEAMKDKRSDVEKSVLKDEEVMCVVFGGSEKCQ